MHDTSILVEIFQRIRYLYNDVSREVFTKVSQTDNLVEKLATRAQLEDDVVVLPGLGEVDQVDDIRVVELAHDLNFFEDVGSLVADDVSMPLLPDREVGE